MEVSNGRARNYGGDYDAYVYSVNKEIEEGERERAGNKLASVPDAKSASTKSGSSLSGKEHHNARKTLRNLEKAIARLDGQRKELNAEMLTTTDAKKSLELHNQVNAIQVELSEAEEKMVRTLRTTRRLVAGTARRRMHGCVGMLVVRGLREGCRMALVVPVDSD